jgi:hypothetical protein
MTRKWLVAVVSVVTFSLPATAEASSISMSQVRQIAKRQARREMIVYDASGYRVTCNQTGRITAYCRLRLLNATDSDGASYDCSIFVKYKLHANGYIYSKLAGDYC